MGRKKLDDYKYPLIRIDDAVMAELKKKAVELDMVFATPNMVLRKILKLETRRKYKYGKSGGLDPQDGTT